MATIVSPSSSPVPVYNIEGRTVDTITASGTDASTATVIIQFVQETIVLVAGIATSGSGVVLPANSSIGDLVETLKTGGSAFNVYTDSGDTLDGVANNFSPVSVSATFRKVSATNWIQVVR